ncbi:reticulophagy regulator 3-like [Watersipora subatra]|uniref:reticulophagy regulator 3-like n=1 Tax=Watersipora subatra TaxID=2589382 RepID=UPI00355AE60B
MESTLASSQHLGPFQFIKQLDSSPENARRLQDMLEVWLSPYETKLLQLQSLLVWTHPLRSFLATALVVIVLGALCSTHVIGAVCFFLLTIFWIDLWWYVIWPTIRVPIPRNEEQEWVPVHIDFLSVADIAHYSARAIIMFRTYGEALYKLRLERRSAFVAIMYAYSACLLVIGHYFSGRVLAFISLFAAVVVPAAVYHNILPTAYVRVKPYLMVLYNKLKPIFETANRRIIAFHQERSSDDDNSDVIPSDFQFLLDSDEINPAPQEKKINLKGTLSPDVSHMPDFERVCDDSQRMFMLDLDVMPSMDVVDRSRLFKEVARLREEDEDTDSDADSLMLDSELSHAITPSAHMGQSASTVPSAPVHPSTVPFTPTIPSASVDLSERVNLPSPNVPPVPLEPLAPIPPYMPPRASRASAQPAGQIGLTLDAFTGAVSQFAAGMFSSMQADHELKQDPPDRIADASIDDDLEGSLAFQDSDEFDYEIISRDELR